VTTRQRTIGVTVSVGVLMGVLFVGVGCGGSSAPAHTGGAAPPDSAIKGPVTAPKTELVQADDDFAAAESQLSAAGDCVAMCKALASMRKATDHLCALTKDGGDDDKKRCDGAKEKVASAEAKVKSTCGGCGP